jgi:RNA methyltransferase, TrmH family
MDELISSSSNPLVKQVRALRQRKGRSKSGLFLVEGIHHVGEAIAAGWRIEVMLYSPEQLTSSYARDLLDTQSRLNIHCAALKSELFREITDKEHPQGILAIVHKRKMSLEDVSVEQFRLGAALVTPQDPGNVGTILRTLDSVGANGLFLLDGGVDPYHPSVVRASMGSIFWIPPVEASFDEFITWARRHVLQLVGTSAHASSDYRVYKRGSQPVVLVLGSEQKGLSQEQVMACDLNLTIPMKGRASSLNLAVAAGILLFALAE